MKSLLELEGLWSAVDPDAAAASQDKDDKGDVVKNTKALALIVLHVEEYYLQTASKATSAKSLWVQLAATNQAKSSARKAVLRKQLLTFQKAASEPVSVYFERAKALWYELTSAGLEIQESEICWTVLSGLPKKYDMIVTVLNHQAEELLLDAILPELLQVEQSDDTNSPREGTVAAYGATYGMPKQRKCNWCLKRGHLEVNCYDKKKGVPQNIAF